MTHNDRELIAARREIKRMVGGLLGVLYLKEVPFTSDDRDDNYAAWERGKKRFTQKQIAPAVARIEGGIWRDPIPDYALVGHDEPERRREGLRSFIVEHAAQAHVALKRGNLPAAFREAGAAQFFSGLLSADEIRTLSTKDAGALLAAASAQRHESNKQKFERRFAELGMAKNRAAVVLAEEFGIKYETARKKLQGVAVSA